MHLGRNVRKIRELLEVKQESLAELLKVSQQTISKIEQAEYLSDHAVERIAGALNIPASVISRFNEQTILTYLNELPKPTVTNADETLYLTLFETIIDLYGKLLKVKFGKT